MTYFEILALPHVREARQAAIDAAAAPMPEPAIWTALHSDMASSVRSAEARASDRYAAVVQDACDAAGVPCLASGPGWDQAVARGRAQ